ncbi:MAG: methylated-DNA--[protein]-cysteine S-methyltransferase [Deltaproteobacteria bacterium]|nr:methylated-DNA--[protein]-cysteine S-methyltransferase [Deltaproteobacteria bacterium]
MNDRLRLFVDHLDTPIGRFAIVADAEGCLRAAGFTDRHARMELELKRSTANADFELEEAVNPGGLTEAMARYFAGELAAIEALPTAAEGTEFQKAVWRALREIPCGETRSYGDLARRIGRPNAVRAVGLANGSNPIAVIVPCHRVIGSDGSLTGYGGGVERKAWLLAHERGTRQLALGFAQTRSR